MEMLAPAVPRRCPRCGAPGPFAVVASGWIVLDPAGRLQAAPPPWAAAPAVDVRSSCRCLACDHLDLVGAFQPAES